MSLSARANSIIEECMRKRDFAGRHLKNNRLLPILFAD